MPPTADAPRRAGRPGHDQATVLRRAVALFIRQGYDATSVGDLARELGVTKSAIYHHVEAKEDLLAAALDEALDGLARAVDTAVASHDTSPLVRLRTAVEQSVLILADHLPAVTLLLRVRGNSPVEQAALQRRRVIDDALAELVREAAAAGEIRGDVAPEVVSRLLFGTVNSLVEWYRPGGPLEPEALARTVTGVVFEGLLVQRERPADHA